MIKEKEMTTKSDLSRSNRACVRCRRQKMRCEGADDPPCRRCRNAMLDCVFERRTDYVLNPEDKAWQAKIEEKINGLTKSVQDICEFLRVCSSTSFQNQPLPPSINVHRQDHNHSHEPQSDTRELTPQPTIQSPSINTPSEIQPRLPALLVPEGISQHHVEPFCSANIGELYEVNTNNRSLPHPLLTRHNSQLITEDQAQEIFRSVQERYRMQLPIFKLMPDPNLPHAELGAWAKTLHPFVSSVILSHGSSHHPSRRWATLFKSLLNESVEQFKQLVRPMGMGDKPDPSHLVSWTDVTNPVGYKIVLAMCVATIYLAPPTPPYRFLSPSHVCYLLRCPSLYEACDDLFGTHGIASANQLSATHPNEPTALARYTLYIWLYMIFCHFNSPDLTLPDDISGSPSVTEVRRLLSLRNTADVKPGVLQMLCAHSELLGLQQWSRKKWLHDNQWTPTEFTNFSDLHTRDSSLAVWSSRFQETRAKLNDWNLTWRGTEAFGSGFLSRMVWMHYEAKQAANYASALFRLPSDPSSWGCHENLYDTALEGVKQACFLLQCFIGEEPLRGQRCFPISQPSLAPWQSSKDAGCSEGINSPSDRAEKRTRLDDCEGATRGIGVHLKDHLATCPVSIQRYPIPFACVILKAIHLKQTLGPADLEAGANGVRRKVFEELQVEGAFNLLERVIHVCAMAGLDGNHPVSPTAFELTKMLGNARRFVNTVPSTSSPGDGVGSIQV